MKTSACRWESSRLVGLNNESFEKTATQVNGEQVESVTRMAEGKSDVAPTMNDL